MRRAPFALALLLAALSGVAHAAAGDDSRRAVVLPTELGGYFMGRDSYRRELGMALEQRLRAAQFNIVRPSPADAECREFDCLTRIADVHNANILVATRVINNLQVKLSYRLRVRVVERVGDKSTTREREQGCENCSEPEVRDRLVKLMSAVIANEPDVAPSGPVASSPATSEQQTPPAVSNPPQRSQPPSSPVPPRETGMSPKTLGVLAGVTGAVGVAGIVLTALGGEALSYNHKPSCGGGVSADACPRRYDTTAQGGAMVGVGVTLTVGAAVLLGLELHGLREKTRKRNYSIAPTIGTAGAGLVIGGAW